MPLSLLNRPEAVALPDCRDLIAPTGVGQVVGIVWVDNVNVIRASFRGNGIVPFVVLFVGNGPIPTKRTTSRLLGQAPGEVEGRWKLCVTLGSPATASPNSTTEPPCVLLARL